jgi:hypothetical protein
MCIIMIIHIIHLLILCILLSVSLVRNKIIYIILKYYIHSVTK